MDIEEKKNTDQIVIRPNAKSTQDFCKFLERMIAQQQAEIHKIKTMSVFNQIEV